jgi:NAD(P)-dependent dehydrogenase (short-subunit alcohol dehydrogenase family)
MDLRLRDRHVLLAGATGGLGAACAAAFAAEGARLSLLGRNWTSWSPIFEHRLTLRYMRCQSI